ncbi:E3 ubiquitin-protein ligase ubr1 [Entomophthora muscae]|uniref:E3 ubiquitin-protein ligase ubr1 n=1 Tax=Entomophthora muscae TaxID=34485 RepID=A0ACC2U5F7_9FUNG|nr:E3 ubiquitin-protein ligase ubr1 [Entomophthora muscae]
MNHYPDNAIGAKAREEGDWVAFEASLDEFFSTLPPRASFKLTDEIKVWLVDVFNKIIGCPEFYYDSRNDRICFGPSQAKLIKYDPFFTRKSTFCGRLLEKGEAVYKCRDCGVDPNCALCSACFDATDHEGHDVGVMLHNDRDCCCGCGDPEVWKPDMFCPYHNPSHDHTMEDMLSEFPLGLQHSISSFIRVTLDLAIRVLRYSPESIFKEQDSRKIKADALKMARAFNNGTFSSGHFSYSLIVWDDDVHTFSEFERLCQAAVKCSPEKAKEFRIGLNKVGRQAVDVSNSIETLLAANKVFSVTGFNCSIRSSFATFMEDLSGFLIHYFVLLASSQALEQHHNGKFVSLVLNILSQHLSSPHRDALANVKIETPGAYPKPGRPSAEGTPGQEYSHIAASYNTPQMEGTGEFVDSVRYMVVESEGLSTDGMMGEEEMDENEPRGGIFDIDGVNEDFLYLEDPEMYPGPIPDISLMDVSPYTLTSAPQEEGETYPLQTPPPPVPRHRFDWFLCLDDIYWRRLRIDLRRLYTLTPLIASKELRFQTAVHFVVNYPAYLSKPLLREPSFEQGMLAFSAQLLSVPSVAAFLVREMNFLSYLLSLVERFFTPAAPDLKEVGCYSRTYTDVLKFCDVYSFRPAAMVPQTPEFKSKLCTLIMQDLHLILEHGLVQELLPQNHLHVAQFLYFLTYFQGMNPNCRKFDTHVEFETDTFIAAFEASFYVYRMMRPFAHAFRFSPPQLAKSIRRTMYKLNFWISRVTEGKVDFKTVVLPTNGPFAVVDFQVESGAPVSFHYLLHWFLSLLFLHTDLLDPSSLRTLGFENLSHLLVGCTPQNSDYESNFSCVMAILDFPLRAVVKSSQIRANLWVRNGYAIRSQVVNYRETTDSLFYLDLFLVQYMLVLFPPHVALYTLLDRFSLNNLLTFDLTHPVYDKNQMLDMTAEFFTLLIHCLTERGRASNQSPEMELRREIIHYTIKPISFSDLDRLLPDRILDECNFSKMVRELCIYKPHETMNDTGTYKLRPEFFNEVNPYFYLSSRNTREIAEQLKRNSGLDQYFRPHLVYIQRGPFTLLGNLIHDQSMTLIIFYTLYHCLFSENAHTLLEDVLQLYLIAAEDRNSSYMAEGCSERQGLWFYTSNSYFPCAFPGNEEIREVSCLTLLLKVSNDGRFQPSRPKLTYILDFLHRHSSPFARSLIVESRNAAADNIEAAAKAEADQRRRDEAKARRARIMNSFTKAQTDFMKNQEELYNETRVVEGELEAEDDSMGDLSPAEKPYLTGNCLVCQEEGSSAAPYGILAFAQPSKLLSILQLADVDLPATVNCEGQGLVLQRMPYIAQRLANFDTDPTSPQYPPSSDGTAFGVHLSSCGHILHLACLEKYYAQLENRQNTNPARNHIENINFREIVCPLCKSISNTILPILGNPGLAHWLIGNVPLSGSWTQALAKTWDKLLSRLDELDPSSLREINAICSETIVHPYVLRTKSNPNSPAPCPFNGDLHAGLTEPLSMTGSALPFAALQSRRRAQVLTPSRTGGMINEFMDQLSATAFLPTGDPLTNEQLRDFFDYIYPGDVAINAYKQFLDIFRITYAQRSLHQPTVPAWREYSQTRTLLDPVVACFAYTITFVEITDRTMQAGSTDTGLVIDRTPTITRDLLVVFWGTILSMHAAAGPRYEATSIKRALSLLSQFHVNNYDSILLCEPFQILIELSLTAIPLALLDVRHVIRLLILVMTAKTLVGCFAATTTHSATNPKGGMAPMPPSLEQLTVLIGHHGLNLTDDEFRYAWENRGFKFAFPFVYQNILVFMRKALLFLDACQISLSRGLESTGVELDDILACIGLPAFDEILAQTLNDETERTTIIRWCRSTNHYASGYRLMTVEFPYPYRLTALPPRMDQLFSACRRIRCAGCDSPPTNPGVCLSCGAVVCVQADCCRMGEEGEANMHRKTCAGHIGSFLIVQSCSVLHLHYRNGSYYFAPYLDAHGEGDIELRKARPLFLDKKRYNSLLKSYLNHSIPQSICRRLEANFDFGGWPTL